MNRAASLRDELENTYRSHRQGLFSLAMSITGCRQSAEDAVHSAFERLCRSTRPDGDVVNYVFAAVRNAARDALRSNQRAAKSRESIFNGAVSDGTETTDPASDVLNAERDQILRAAMEDLGDDAREVVVMKIFAELTFDAIGEVLNQPAKTVATRYRRALIRLEEKLRGQL
ncbi:RNA polymerase sigma factor [Fuerstiella marisgermanici]|uniref:Sigma-W factor n=1 Tax=Fuerstiella marisgermanici TaxID=1891926 RepID=A0A1P8WPU7_9PLAN|nr:sigma-70 family RNA polymerase sigma factor [Fuerstiella marisgermanici]APZ96086.1 Sigma-W factor [Fuerstiella marisgermanici]